MTRAFATLIAGAVFLALAAPALGAQEPESGALRIENVDTDAYPDVRVKVTASAAEGALPADAFGLREGGAPRDIDVERVSTADLEIVLLLDGTGSMGGAPIAAARDAASAFVRKLPPDTRTAVLGYDTETTVLSEPSTDIDAHLAGIEQLTAGGRTATYDAVGEALEHFTDRPEATQALILLTDGEDNASTTGLDEITDRLADSGVTLYVIEFMTAFTDSAALEQLVGATGGELREADDPEALNAVYDDFASQLFNQYELRYRSEASGSTEVSVRVDHDGAAEEDSRTVEFPAVPTPTPTPVPTPPEPDEPPVLRVLSVNTDDHPNVVLRVLAPRQLRDTELDAGAFTVVEGGIAREVEVTRVTQLELDVVLSIDTSGSMRGESIEQAKAAAVLFVENMPQTTRVAVQEFNGTPVLVQDFTTDTDVLIEAINGLEASGWTALYDAAVDAADMFDADHDAVRSVIILSDGADTASEASLELAADRLAASGAVAHAIELRNAHTDPVALERLVRPSGGDLVSADEPDALADLYAEIAADLANQYLLYYRSTGHGTTELHIGVDQDGVRAEAIETVELPPMSRVQSFFASGAGLFVGAALVYLAMALIILMVLAPAPARTRLAPAGATAAGGNSGAGSTVLSGLADWATAIADRRLERHNRRQSVNTLLERAGLNLRAGEFVVITVCAAVGAGALGALASGFLVGLAFCAVAVLVAYLTLRFLAGRRRAAFADQLGDTLQLLAGSLRAGYSVLQAVDAVAREADSPTAEEFRRLVVETRLGRDLTEALQAMADRVGNEDFTWVVQAIGIHREVGGDLADVLDTVAGTIRERNQIRRQVKALSAEGRLSAWVLLALPFAVGGFLWFSNREYLLELTQHLAGWAMLFAAVGLMLTGTLWLRKIVRIEF